MLTKKIHDELNAQLQREFQSAYLYLAMSSYATSKNMDGTAKWMMLQAEEEVGHAMKIYKYICEREGRAILHAVPQPKVEFASILEIFETSLQNERALAEALNNLSSLALSEKDNTTYTFLEWFLTEQIEEINSCVTIIHKLKLTGDNGYGLLMIDQELGGRQPEAPQKAGE